MTLSSIITKQGSSWSWVYGRRIYNYLCNQSISPLMFWVRTLSWRGVLDTTLCDKICHWLVTGRWFSPVSSTNKTDHHDKIDILLKVVLNTIKQTIKSALHENNKPYPTEVLITVIIISRSLLFPLYLRGAKVVYGRDNSGLLPTSLRAVTRKLYWVLAESPAT